MTLASCADVYDGDEVYSSDVRNETMVSPDAAKITVTASTDGTQQTIAWPVVYGAGGYELIVTDVTDPGNTIEIMNKNVDGCSVTLARDEDRNYTLSLRTLGDKELNNKDAETAATLQFTTFLPSVGTIPAGSDIADYFAENSIPESAATEMVCYDLVPGGMYTLNRLVEFANKKVTIRTASANKATVVYGAEGKITTYTGCTLKNLNIDCSAQTSSTASVIQLSETPDESIKGIQKEGEYKSTYYDIQDNIVLQGLNIQGLPGYIFFDGNKVAYGLRALTVKDCVIELVTSSEHSVKENALINSYKGFIKDFSMMNTTIWTNPTTAKGKAKFMIRYNNSGRPDRYGYAKASVNFSNSTFYNVCKGGQWANYDGIGNAHKWAVFNMQSCIFLDCGNKDVARRFIRNKPDAADDITFKNNTYMYEGDFENDEYDTSGTAIKSDPQFENAASGNFKVNGSEQLAKRTGDPRWLPEVEAE